MDEAFGVRRESESTIQQALERLQRGRTTLVIAHRCRASPPPTAIISRPRAALSKKATERVMTRSNGVYQALMARAADDCGLTTIIGRRGAR